MKSKTTFKRDALLVGILLVLSFVLLKMPTGFEDRVAKGTLRSRGRVLDVDNSEVMELGLIKTGDQGVTVRILDGPFKGREVSGNNPLLGLLHRDKIFAAGDTALVVLSLDEKGEIGFVNPQEHYRLGVELLLLGFFSLALILFGGWTGAKALLSFVFSALMLWKVLVPSMLKGYNPVLISLAVVAILTGVIMFLVAGATRKGIVAFLGAFLGVLTSCVMAIYFTKAFHAHGAVMHLGPNMIYAGFPHLNLTEIYIAAVFIAASGAVMDLAMDVAAAMDELVSKKKDITMLEAIKSGFSVGRAVVGTMTTTLLFAYSGGYITLVMAFVAQGVPLANLFNFIYVSTEILKTLVGSFGLVMVAPFTAIVGGLVLVPKRGIGGERKEGDLQSIWRVPGRILAMIASVALR
jgi:uncharacterized membrane protein